MSLSKSLLIEQLAAKRKDLALRDVESAVKIILDAMADTMAEVKTSRFCMATISFWK